MEIKGTVHCLFEQSGTFKNEFKKIGISAFDYDIQNEFNETDFQIDLFNEINNAYQGKESIFDNFKEEDLLLAFFPCIYFETIQMLYYNFNSLNNKHKVMTERITDAIERLQKRTEFHTLLYKLVYISYKCNLRLIIENPATKPNYLIDTQNFPKPTLIDNDRTLRGDFMKKPTDYWFFNCKNTFGFSCQKNKEVKTILNIRGGQNAGICNTERSLISSDYARNFIFDFLLGK